MAIDCYTIQSMVIPFLLGSTIVFLRERMLESGFKTHRQPFSFSFARISPVMQKGDDSDTPMYRGSTPKHMPYPLVLCHAILSVAGKGGVCH